ncbi:MAG TPA: hypothetical protein H9727_05535 [Candidatus Borkfalkia avistercoris]|uniref:Uncharacterized protein n=1 Tax=Candidatus Borkfalkia avistercoris TaxID=2838504 RepID=A0A9D2CZG7_9FIRM|nr:hypothetical protein [Candidatus Borkfalkia avistercoris]
MIFSLLTVLFYTASSLGDKFIASKLQCGAREFSFLVSVSTAVFLALAVPFAGWAFAFTGESCVILLALTACKIAEFYTSASLLKTVSAYELKAWLSRNVAVSFLVDLLRGRESFFIAFVPCAVVLAAGIGMIAFGSKKIAPVRYVLLSLAYIASKFFYGLQINMLPEGPSPRFRAAAGNALRRAVADAFRAV